MNLIPQDQDCTVMIVDDSVWMRNMLSTMLDMKGFKVVAEAADGNEAVEKYLALRPQITFMDILMPHKSGREATKEIISLDGNAKVVMCSSLGNEELIKAAIESGARDVLSKPYRDNQLEEVLQRVMQF